MFFKPLDRMWERVETAKDHSDTDLFLSLMYLGEMTLKLTAVGLVAAINDGKERHRYRQHYQLVRASGIGDWSKVIDEVLTGASSQHLSTYAYKEQNELISVNKAGTWQYNAVNLITECLSAIDLQTEAASKKVSARQWFQLFTNLRNKTRAHGAIPSRKYSEINNNLEESMLAIIQNFSLFQRPWAYLHQNLSGKYRVTKWSPRAETLDFLKVRHNRDIKLPNGIYIHFDETQEINGLVKIELIDSDADASDFFFANGGFNGKRYVVNPKNWTQKYTDIF
ncbi:MAG: hypothetical protein H6673_07875 [Anaerolineales bacterium]|nr:hypothetical protein [Anaerolineales bacterium]